MATASTDSIEVTQPFNRMFRGILNISIANYGANDVTLTRKGVTIVLPAFNATAKLPIGAFAMDCNGYLFDEKIEINFPNGASKVIINTAKLLS